MVTTLTTKGPSSVVLISLELAGVVPRTICVRVTPGSRVSKLRVSVRAGSPIGGGG